MMAFYLLQKYTFSRKRQGLSCFLSMAIAEYPADIELFVALAEMRNDVKQKLVKGE